MTIQKVNKAPLLTERNFTVAEVQDLNFFDLTGESAKTQGTSSKTYHIELHVGNSGDLFQIYTLWGATGSNLTKEWRHYTERSKAEKDFAAIIQSKLKKGYRLIDIAQRAQGSTAAKAIIKPVILKNTIIEQNITLPAATQELIQKLFGSTAQFVATTLKCPLGQLTNEQIERGRSALNKAKIILNTKTGPITSSDSKKLLELTNEFYGEIPHNFGQGSRGQMTELLFDDINKVVQKEADLDTLWDAKSVGAALTGTIEAQYNELQADLTWINPQDPIFIFISDYFQNSKVRNHGFNSSYLKNLWSLKRKDKESEYFLKNSNLIAKECGNHSFAIETSSTCRQSKNWIPSKRPDLTSDQIDLFTRANTWLCWHGTRSANVVGITKRGLLVRPVGAIHTGSMMGDGKYFAWASTKSLNYTDGGYWTGGKSKNTSRFMFLLDVSLGNTYKTPRAQFYKNPPIGYHSVYGKAGYSGLMNDEMVTYDFTQKNTQSQIRYLLEISD